MGQISAYFSFITPLNANSILCLQLSKSTNSLVTRCDQLEKSKTQENNHLEASVNKQTSRSIKRLQKAINNEIDRG
ncbi:MAG: hypothetical protein Q9M50_02925 [Methylococcales bacterium]|nr:hypothetical protein [Methylococcales bacterium]